MRSNTVTLRSLRLGCQLVTSKICQPIRQDLSRVQVGMLYLFVESPGASLSLNENADDTVQSDLTEALLRIVPDCKDSKVTPIAR